MFDTALAERYIAYDPYQAMDLRHIRLLYELLAAIKPEVAVEVGVCYGASLTAFRMAFAQRHVKKVIAIDPDPHNVANDLYMEIRHGLSQEILPTLNFDFVFLDGDHSVEQAYREAPIINAKRPRVVCAHDTTALIAGYTCCPGPQHMKRWLQTNGYFILEDSMVRENERTNRGFLAAFRNVDDWELGVEAFKKVCA